MTQKSTTQTPAISERWQDYHGYLGELIEDGDKSLDAKYSRKLIEELSLAESQLAGQQQVLKLAEWFVYSDNVIGTVAYCPVCRNTKTGGHAPSCRLKALLAGAPK